jgi:hypothetical protein
MRDLCSRYAQLFHERHGSGGHLFQSRFGSKLVASDQQLAQLLRYIARNPVRAGLCADPAAWPWSSHAGLLDGGRQPIVSTQRVSSLLGEFRDGRGTPYGALFEPNGPLRHLSPDLSPWELRPSLAEIVRSTDLTAAVRRAKRHGYRVAEVAAHLGVSEATLWRRVKEKGPVPL